MEGQRRREVGSVDLGKRIQPWFSKLYRIYRCIYTVCKWSAGNLLGEDGCELNLQDEM
jgi:hypothetical protein